MTSPHPPVHKSRRHLTVGGPPPDGWLWETTHNPSTPAGQIDGAARLAAGLRDRRRHAVTGRSRRRPRWGWTRRATVTAVIALGVVVVALVPVVVLLRG
jgi:hypothetical protein